MSKIEELIERIRQKPYGWDTIEFFEHDIETIMIEYAEFYAKKCLELSDQEINMFENITRPTELKLPEHE